MTLIEEILSLSSSAGSDAAGLDAAGLHALGIDDTQVYQAARGDLAAFAAAADRGAHSAVARAVRELRPGYASPGGGTPAKRDAGNGESGPHAAWAAWATAAAAIAALSAGPARQAQAEDLTIPMTVCAAATALGEDCLVAVAAGTRAASLIATRLAGAEGWSVPVLAAAIGATVAAAAMLSLTDDALRRAIGMAATQAAGLRAATVTDAGPIQAGKAAFNAVEAVFLARAGFTSSRDPLEGRRGLLVLFADGGRR